MTLIYAALTLFSVSCVLAVRTTRFALLDAGNAKVTLSSHAALMNATYLNRIWLASRQKDHYDYSNAQLLSPAAGLGSKPDDAFFQAVVQSMGIKSGEPCVEAAGEPQMGCLANCQCSWGRQCYPKFVYVNDLAMSILKLRSSPRPRVNLGICQTSIAMLCFLSMLCFLIFLMCIVSVRTYLRLKEGEDMPVQGVIQSTRIYTPVPLVDGSSHTTTLTIGSYAPAPGKVVIGQAMSVSAASVGQGDHPIDEAGATYRWSPPLPVLEDGSLRKQPPLTEPRAAPAEPVAAPLVHSAMNEGVHEAGAVASNIGTVNQSPGEVNKQETGQRDRKSVV